MVVSCSICARSSCSSSGTIRNVPTWAERSQVEGGTALSPAARTSGKRTVPLAKICAKPPPFGRSGPQRDCRGVGRMGRRDEEPRILTPSDILPLEDTEGKERTSLLCLGLSRWPVPSSLGSQDCSDIRETILCFVSEQWILSIQVPPNSWLIGQKDRWVLAPVILTRLKLEPSFPAWL